MIRSTCTAQTALLAFAALTNAHAPGGQPLTAQEVIVLPGEDRLLETNFEEVYRIGSYDGDEWETFGRVSGVSFDDSGNLYVMDDQAGRIVVVSQGGAFVREFGRIGDGPGEFAAHSNTAVGFTVLRDGRAVVFDPGHGAFAVFGPDGEFERSVPMSGSAMYLIRTLKTANDGENVITTAVSGFNSGGSTDAVVPFRPIFRLVLTGMRSFRTR